MRMGGSPLHRSVVVQIVVPDQKRPYRTHFQSADLAPNLVPPSLFSRGGKREAAAEEEEPLLPIRRSDIEEANNNVLPRRNRAIEGEAPRMSGCLWLGGFVPLAEREKEADPRHTITVHTWTWV